MKEKIYSIDIRQTFKWNIPITAKSKKEALKKAQTYFEFCEDDYTGVASAGDVEKTDISISNTTGEYKDDEIKAVEDHFQEILRENIGDERVPELEKKIKELQEVDTSKTDDPYFDSEEFNEEWNRVMTREERHEKKGESE